MLITPDEEWNVVGDRKNRTALRVVRDSELRVERELLARSGLEHWWVLYESRGGDVWYGIGDGIGERGTGKRW